MSYKRGRLAHDLYIHSKYIYFLRLNFFLRASGYQPSDLVTLPDNFDESNMSTARYLAKHMYCSETNLVKWLYFIQANAGGSVTRTPIVQFPTR